MRRLQLSDVVSVESGSGFPLEDQGHRSDEFPFLKVSDMNLAGNQREIYRWNHSVSDVVRKKLRAKAFPAGSLIFPKVGAAIGTNKKRQLTCPSCVDNNVMALVPNTSLLDPDFLYFLFLAKNLSDLASDSNPPSIRKSEVERLAVVLPPLPEQRRIVDILSRAEGIVRLRREAEKKAAELIPALFINSFGDPANNPKGWPVAKIGELGRVQLGRQRAPKYQSGAHTHPYVRVANVFEDRIDVSDLLSMDFDKNDFAKYRLEYGDILLNEGQSTELVGRPALWRGEVKDCCFQNTLVRFQPNPDLLRAEFAFVVLLHYYRSGVLSQISSKTSSIAHLGAGRFAKLPLFYPPLALQVEFIKQFDAIRSIQLQQSAATAKALATFDALLADAFRI